MSSSVPLSDASIRYLLTVTSQRFAARGLVDYSRTSGFPPDFAAKLDILFLPRTTDGFNAGVKLYHEFLLEVNRVQVRPAGLAVSFGVGQTRPGPDPSLYPVFPRPGTTGHTITPSVPVARVGSWVAPGFPRVGTTVPLIVPSARVARVGSWGEWSAEAMCSIRTACTVKNLVASAVIIGAIVVLGYAAFRFPYVEFSGAMLDVFAGRGKRAGTFLDGSMNFSASVAKVPVVSNLLSSMNGVIEWKDRVVGLLGKFESFMNDTTLWRTGVNVWMVGDLGVGGVVADVARLETRFRTATTIYKYYAMRQNSQSRRSTNVSRFVAYVEKRLYNANRSVTLRNQIAMSAVEVAQSSVTARAIADLKGRLDAHDTAEKADAISKKLLEDARVAREAANLARENEFEEARLKREGELEKRIGDAIEAMKAKLQSEFDASISAAFARYNTTVNSRFSVFNAAQLMYAARSWHTELVLGMAVGTLGTTVVALLSSPALLVAVASGGGLVAGIAGVVQSALVFFGYKGVIEAAAAAAAATATAAAAAAAA